MPATCSVTARKIIAVVEAKRLEEAESWNSSEQITKNFDEERTPNISWLPFEMDLIFQ